MQLRIANAAEECRDPSNDIPRAMCLGVRVMDLGAGMLQGDCRDILGKFFCLGFRVGRYDKDMTGIVQG